MYWIYFRWGDFESRLHITGWASQRKVQALKYKQLSTVTDDTENDGRLQAIDDARRSA